MRMWIKKKTARRKSAVAHTHIIHAFFLSLVVIIVHVIGILPEEYMPLTLIITLLLFQDTLEKSKMQWLLMMKSLIVVIPMAICINLWLQPYILTLPLAFFMLLVIFRLIKFPFYIVVPGVLLIVAYFQSVPYWFYLVLALDIIVFSSVAYILAIKFHVTALQQFREVYQTIQSDFRDIVQRALNNEKTDLTMFFQRITTLEELLDMQLKQNTDLDGLTILQLDQMVQEIQESYFYLRMLVGYKSEVSEEVAISFEKHDWMIQKCSIVSDGIYGFHAKELLSHYENWLMLVDVLQMRGKQL